MKGIIIQLDRERRLKLTLNSMVEIEERTGKSFGEIGEAWKGGGFKVADLRAVLFACLKDDDPDLTIEKVGDLIDLSNMTTIVGKLSESFSSSLPESGSDFLPTAPADDLPSTPTRAWSPWRTVRRSTTTRPPATISRFASLTAAG